MKTLTKIAATMFAILSFILYFQVTSQSSLAQDPALLTYTNSSLDIKFDYPVDWSVKDGDGYPGISLFPNVNTSSTGPIDIMILNRTDNRNFSFPKHYNFKDIDTFGSSPAKLLDNLANRTVYFTEENGVRYQVMKITTIQNNRNYTVFYGGESGSFLLNSPLLQGILDSMENILQHPDRYNGSESSIHENAVLGVRFSYSSDLYEPSGDVERCLLISYCQMSLKNLYGKYYDPLLEIAAYLPAQDRPINFMEEWDGCYCDSLIEFVRYVYGFTSDYSGFTFINDNQTTVGKKYPASQFEYSINETKSIAVATKFNDTFYLITSSAKNEDYPKKLSEFKKVLDSIEFFEIAKPQEPITKTPSFMIMNQTENQNSTLKENTSNTLKILSHNSFVDIIGAMHIVGEVKNISPSNAQFVKVIATFYDINKQVVGTDFTYTAPSTIPIDNTAPFELILSSASIPIEQIESYKLSLTWQ